MVELFRIGHYSIYLFGVTIVLGMLAGIFIMIRETKRKGLDTDQMMDLTRAEVKQISMKTFLMPRRFSFI